MMTQLKFTRLKNWYLFMLTIVLFGIVSCDQAHEETSKEITAEAPSSSISADVFMNNTKNVKAHIAAKTDLNEKDDYGSAPLHIAATFGKTEVAKLLIEGGANVNEPDANGSTPLHTAAFLGRTEIVKALLENNVDINARNSFNSTALESVSGPFDDVKAIYDQFSKDLGPLGFKLDYNQLREQRSVIAGLITSNSK
jgi:ankyrin repeat protein